MRENNLIENIFGNYNNILILLTVFSIKKLCLYLQPNYLQIKYEQRINYENGRTPKEKYPPLI